MWNIIKRRNGTTMYRRTEGDYSIWIIDYQDDCEVIIHRIDPLADVLEVVFDRAGYKSFNEASDAAKFALHEIRYGA